MGIELLAGHVHEGSSYCLVCRVGDWLIIATVSGKGRIAYDGADLITEPGDWMLIRPGTPHGYSVESSLKRWDLLRVHFQPHPHWLPWLDWPGGQLWALQDCDRRWHLDGPLARSLPALYR